jgi:hypothetical protein
MDRRGLGKVLRVSDRELRDRIDFCDADANWLTRNSGRNPLVRNTAPQLNRLYRVAAAGRRPFPRTVSPGFTAPATGPTSRWLTTTARYCLSAVMDHVIDPVMGQDGLDGRSGDRCQMCAELCSRNR